MGGSYHTHGDYFLPDLAVPEEDKRPVGVWGQRHLRYIREHRESLYIGLQLSGKLNDYLVQIDKQATDMFLRLTKQVAKLEDISEQLKTQNQMEWVARMNGSRHQVDEIIYTELIYT